jgi:hypothetical protein
LPRKASWRMCVKQFFLFAKPSRIRGTSIRSLEGPARLDEINWLGNLLGFIWPREYLDLLAAHDGVTVRQAHIPSFFDAFRAFIVHREPWHKLQFWPIAEDRCGNYWVLALKEQQNGDSPVYFLDHETETGMAAPDRVVADSIAVFVADYMQSDWARGDDEGRHGTVRVNDRADLGCASWRQGSVLKALNCYGHRRRNCHCPRARVAGDFLSEVAKRTRTAALIDRFVR